MAEERGLPDHVIEHRDEHRAWNAENWSEFEAGGVTESTPLLIEGAFGPKDEQHGAALLDHLRGQAADGVTVEPATGPDGHTYPRITVRLPVRTWSLAALNAWTDDMVATGWRYGGVLFEGYRVTPVESTGLEGLMRDQRKGNRETWAMLQQHGVTPDTALSLEAHFWARSGPAADAIADRLRNGFGYVVEMQAPRRGWLRRGRLWNVTGTSPATTTDPDQLDAWTDSLVRAADQHGVVFDGWGTMLPS